MAYMYHDGGKVIKSQLLLCVMACPRGHHGWDVEGRVMTRGAHEGGWRGAS